MVEVETLIRQAEDLDKDTKNLLDAIKNLSETFDKQGNKLLDEIENILEYSKKMDADDLDKLEHYIDESHALAENIRILFEALNHNFYRIEEIRKKVTKIEKPK